MRAKASTRANSRLAPPNRQRGNEKEETPYNKYMQTHYGQAFCGVVESHISIMSSGFRQRGEDPHIALLKDEAEKTPILRLVQSERRQVDPALNKQKVSERIDQNSFTPVLHDTWISSTPAVTSLAKARYSASPTEAQGREESLQAKLREETTLTEDRLRRTFKQSQSFSAKNRESCRRSTLGAHSSERVKKRKFPDILHDHNKGLRKNQESEPANGEEPTAHDRELNAHCQRLIHAMMQKHNVHCLYISRFP